MQKIYHKERKVERVHACMEATGRYGEALALYLYEQGLYMPAMSALRFNPLIKRFGERLAKNGKCDMVILGAAMRKLLCLAYGVLKSGKPFDQKYVLNLAATH